ncbi:MAG: hypothetical protein ABJN95_17960 [Maribacter sp.]
MKKIIFAVVIFGSIVALSSCNYDDSNDIDVLNPIDSTATGIVQTK